MGLLNDLKNPTDRNPGIGKILYKQTDQAKLKDYTLTQMMKQVRRDVKAGAVKPEP